MARKTATKGEDEKKEVDIDEITKKVRPKEGLAREYLPKFCSNSFPPFFFARFPNTPPKVAEELDIDMDDPELHKAASKIQASFRGHKVRKDVPKEGEN